MVEASNYYVYLHTRQYVWTYHLRRFSSC